MTKLKYPKYKYSGIEWLGDIPEHWEVWKISRAIKSIGSGTTPSSSNSQYYENGTINWLNTGDFNNGILTTTKKKITSKALHEVSSLRLFPKGTLSIAMYGATIGKVCIIQFETTTNQACCNLPQENILNNKFLMYWFISQKKHIINLGYGGGQPNISQDIIKTLQVPTPKFSEQTKIANYLDQKIEKINTFITKKKQLIQLLKEQKAAVINEAVTKGLDKTVKMKDSDLEWLGEIPVHWEVRRLKYLAKISRGAILRPVDEPSYFDKNGEWTYLNISDVTKCDKFLWKGKLRLSELGSQKSARVYPNNLIITASATIGKPFINKIPVCVHDGFIPITKIKSIVSIDFLYNFIGNPKMYNGIGKSNTQKNIYLDEVKSFNIVVPPKAEQIQIVQHIETQTQKIDATIGNIERELELVEEYKVALISEAVTGKIFIN
jgi:type I restriction enzyme S subunit